MQTPPDYHSIVSDLHIPQISRQQHEAIQAAYAYGAYKAFVLFSPSGILSLIVTGHIFLSFIFLVGFGVGIAGWWRDFRFLPKCDYYKPYLKPSQIRNVSS